MTVPTRIEKPFDCVEFKRRVQLRIYEDIRGMSHDEERAYFEEQAAHGPLAEWWQRVKCGRVGKASGEKV